MQCKVCSFCTGDPSVLRKHEMRHEDVSQPITISRFVSTANVYSHFVFHRQKTNYNCTECKYSCIQSINLKSHIKRHHPDFYSQLLCSQCSFVSVNLDALRKHQQDHSLGLIKGDDSNDTEPDCVMKVGRNRSIGTSEVEAHNFRFRHFAI